MTLLSGSPWRRVALMWLLTLGPLLPADPVAVTPKIVIILADDLG